MAPWVTPKFSAILSNLEDTYQQCTGSQRKEVVKQGVLEITLSAQKDQVAIPGGLEKVCSQQIFTLLRLPIPFQKVLVWFQNTQQRKKDKASKKSMVSRDGRAAMTWTLRKVVKEQMSDEVDALVLKKNPEARRGTKDYLVLVQDCLTTLIDGLSKEKKKELTSLAEEWNSTGVDPDIKAKSVQQCPVLSIQLLNSICCHQTGRQTFGKICERVHGYHLQADGCACVHAGGV
jgi:hypothetical protein